MPEPIRPLTGQDVLDLICEYPDHGPKDRREGDKCTYLDDWYNFSAIARALNERFGLKEGAE